MTKSNDVRTIHISKPTVHPKPVKKLGPDPKPGPVQPTGMDRVKQLDAHNRKNNKPKKG